MSGAQSTIFGTEEHKVANLKSRTYQVLHKAPFLRKCRHAHIVTLQLAKNMKMGVADTRDDIKLPKSTFNWIIQNIPNVERYIREFNIDNPPN